MRYIDAEKLITIIEERKAQQDQWANRYHDPINQGISHELTEILSIIEFLQQEQDMGEVFDGYHTFNELYYYRMLYNAAFFNLLPKDMVHKSKKHHSGEECFGGGWFIVMANLPNGQISNHYELKDWDLFKVPEKEFADEWDGHTPQEAAERLYEYLQLEQPEELVLMAESFLEVLSKTPYNNKPITDVQAIVKQLLVFLNNPKLYNPDTISQLGQQEEDLEKYISNKLRELGADLINHKPYSFNRGLNVGMTNAYEDILEKIKTKKEDRHV